MAGYRQLRAIAIPTLRGLPNRKVENQLNTQLFRLVATLLRQQGYRKSGIGIWTEHSVTLNDLGAFSLWYDVYAYQSGAAHGLTVRTSATYDMQNGRSAGLATLFLPRSAYLERLSMFIKQQLRESETPLIKDFVQISPEEGFYLTRDEIVIYFQVYEYTPYFVGIPEFRIPYSSLADILRPDGLASRFLDKTISS